MTAPKGAVFFASFGVRVTTLAGIHRTEAGSVQRNSFLAGSVSDEAEARELLA